MFASGWRLFSHSLSGHDLHMEERRVLLIIHPALEIMRMRYWRMQRL